MAGPGFDALFLNPYSPDPAVRVAPTSQPILVGLVMIIIVADEHFLQSHVSSPCRLPTERALEAKNLLCEKYPEATLCAFSR